MMTLVHVFEKKLCSAMLHPKKLEELRWAVRVKGVREHLLPPRVIYCCDATAELAYVVIGQEMSVSDHRCWMFANGLGSLSIMSYEDSSNAGEEKTIKPIFLIFLVMQHVLFVTVSRLFLVMQHVLFVTVSRHARANQVNTASVRKSQQRYMKKRWEKLR